jgi:hypothetical protein
MSKNVKESDWRAFRDSLVEWRERYLETTTQEIADVLQEEGASPTERFWNAKERIDEEATILRDCLDGHSRSKMDMHLVLMYRHGLIDDADLERFSDELRNWVLVWFEKEDRHTGGDG